MERRLGRVVVAQDAEAVEQVVPGTVRVAEGEQLPVRDLQLRAQGMHRADDSLQDDGLLFLRPVRARRPAVLAVAQATTYGG